MRKCILVALLFCAGIIAVVMFAALESPVEAQQLLVPGTMGESGDGFILAFDVSGEKYASSFRVPTRGANPWDIEVVAAPGNHEIWFTEPGSDRLARLVYTDTLNYDFREYPVAGGCGPLNLDVAGDYVWFTQPGCNRIGRLQRTSGMLTDFSISTEDSYPADLFVDTDGSIWFTQMQANQIARMVVTSSVQYAIEEYASVYLADGRPYGIVRSGQGVYVAQRTRNNVVRFDPNTNSWAVVQVPGSNVNEPFNLVPDGSGGVWATERSGNRITQFSIGTFPIVNPFTLTPSASLPLDLVIDGADRIWCTQWTAGQIVRLDPTTATRTHYPLPMQDLGPTGIALDDQERLWILASGVYRLHLPLVLNGYASSE